MSAPMGAAPGQESLATVECWRCGRENPIKGTYCHNCNQRLLVLPFWLEQLQNQNQELRAQIESLQQELDNFNAPNPKPEQPHPLLGEVHDKLKAAEENVARLEQQLAAKAKEFEELTKSPTAPTEPDDWHFRLAEVHGKLKAAEERTAKWLLHSMGLEGKCNAAEDNVARLEQQLAAKTKEFEEFTKTQTGPTEPVGEHSLVAELQHKLKAHKEEVVAWASQVTALEGKRKAAEGNAAALATQLADKEKEVQTLSKKKVFTLISAVVGVLGTLGGFGTGRYMLPADNADVKQLSTQLAGAQQQLSGAQQQVKDLKSSLDQTIAKAAKDRSDLELRINALTDEENQLQTKLDGAVVARQLVGARLTKALASNTSVNQQLKDQTNAAIAAAEREKQAKAQLNSAIVTQHSAETKLAQAQVSNASLNQQIKILYDKISGLTGQLSLRGAFSWTGNIAGKRTIEIRDGLPSFGSVRGALPGKACTVSTHDGRVKIKTRPSDKNHWNEISFEVSGTGVVEVRIDWELSH